MKAKPNKIVTHLELVQCISLSEVRRIVLPLTTGQCSAIELIRRRALKIILPDIPYHVACESLSIHLLSNRRKLLCFKMAAAMKGQKQTSPASSQV